MNGKVLVIRREKLNIRISNQSIRLRVSYEEFRELQKGVTLSEQITMPQTQTISFYLNSASSYGCVFEEGEFKFHVLDSALGLLAEQLPSKSGLEWETQTSSPNSLKIVLEVDVKSKWKIK